MLYYEVIVHLTYMVYSPAVKWWNKKVWQNLLVQSICTIFSSFHCLLWVMSFSLWALFRITWDARFSWEILPKDCSNLLSECIYFTFISETKPFCSNTITRLLPCHLLWGLLDLHPSEDFMLFPPTNGGKWFCHF